MTITNQPKAIVIISGKAQYGKTTLANNVANTLEQSGFTSTIIPLAESLRDEAKEFYGWNGRKDQAGRTLLQQIGESRRANDLDYWCKKVSDKLASTYCDVAIIDDLRYESEFIYFKRIHEDVLSVRIMRSVDGKPYVNNLTSEQKKHISETDLDSLSEYGFFDVYSYVQEGLDNNLKEAGTIVDKVVETIRYNEKEHAL